MIRNVGKGSFFRYRLREQTIGPCNDAVRYIQRFGATRGLSLRKRERKTYLCNDYSDRMKKFTEVYEVKKLRK